jgi:hypothetical protein
MKEYSKEIKFIRKLAYNINIPVNAYDVFSNAFIKSFDENKPLDKCIVDEVYAEKYIQNGKNQNGKKVSADYHKQCNKCKEVKHQTEYMHKYSKKYNINYLDSYCRVCRHEYNNEYRRNLYKNNEKYRTRCIEKSRKYRNKK